MLGKKDALNGDPRCPGISTMSGGGGAGFVCDSVIWEKDQVLWVPEFCSLKLIGFSHLFFLPL